MRNIIVKVGTPWRRVFPFLHKARALCWKVYDRVAQRFIISGGAIAFLDTVLIFPEGVGLTYSTPLFWQGPEAYEPPTSTALSTLIAHASVFLDVGSNIGIYAVYAGVKHPEVTTYAFEPVPVIFEKNRAFHRLNAVDESRVHNLAVGNKVGRQTLILPVYHTGVEEEQTGTLQSESWQAQEAEVQRLEVDCTTLDEFVASHPLPAGRCVAKIDVENHELAVFQGGLRFIRERRPWIVCEILPGQRRNPMTGKRENDNQPLVTLIDDLKYVAFALTAEGYFRMQREDFESPRCVKDFLLLPTEALPPNICYLTASQLPGLLASELRA